MATLSHNTCSIWPLTTSRQAGSPKRRTVAHAPEPHASRLSAPAFAWAHPDQAGRIRGGGVLPVCRARDRFAGSERHRRHAQRSHVGGAGAGPVRWRDRSRPARFGHSAGQSYRTAGTQHALYNAQRFDEAIDVCHLGLAAQQQCRVCNKLAKALSAAGTLRRLRKPTDTPSLCSPTPPSCTPISGTSCISSTASTKPWTAIAAHRRHRPGRCRHACPAGRLASPAQGVRGGVRALSTRIADTA